MEVKIDTKEKFTVITLQESILSANMTEELKQMLLPYLEKETRNVILNLQELTKIDRGSAEIILDLQLTFYDKNVSFVVCEIQKPVEDFFEQHELLDGLNFTPTESEAWDIVQMEEIEREFLD